MGRRRRKNRTHLKGPAVGDADEKVPKSFVIKSGNVTSSLAQLVRDTRQLMEPNTATRLRERPHARLRDYLTIAPSIGVTHLLAFTLTEAANVHLRVARLPQGPTLTFRIGRYSLMKDLVNSALRNVGRAPGNEYRNPPLLVLNNFQQPPNAPIPQLKLMSTMFQGLFPAIQVEKSALPTFRRVLLLSYSHTTNLISLRHYVITVRPHGVSRRVRRLLNATTVNARKPHIDDTDDLADYLLRGRTGAPGSEGGGTAGYDSSSETEGSEAESDSNAVELPEDYVGRGNKKGERKAVRLVETGPRMELQLVKVVEGLVGSRKGEGETVFHEFVHKSRSESKALQKTHDERRRLKEMRRAEQAANVARKKAEQSTAVGKDGVDADSAGEAESGEEDLDVDGLSDLDPEEALERRRTQSAQIMGDPTDLDDFAYEDAEGDPENSDEEDDEEWNEDAGMGEPSSDEDGDSSDSEHSEPPIKRRHK